MIHSISKLLALAWCALIWFAIIDNLIAVEPTALPADAKLSPQHNGYSYQPFELKGARLIPRVEFLQGGRDWERLDVYIPKSAKPGDKLPCIVNVYGGGYGQKGAGALKTSSQPMIDRGYVVVTPDYVLGAYAPETLASWDVANAIRHVRANADKYNVDPERIGLCGWSAGGWISQFIGYANPNSLRSLRFASTSSSETGAQPTIEPRPLYADHPLSVQAVVSDWGAGKLMNGGKHGQPAMPHEMITPDDPPLMSCFNGQPREMPNTTLGMLKSIGVPAEGAFLGDAKSMHVPKFDTPGWNAAGDAMTWIESICDFFDRHVKNPQQSSAPQIVVTPGTATTTTVSLLSTHAIYSNGSVHFTLDGSTPSASSPIYEQPIELNAGQTVRAIAIEPGLSPSRVASFTATTLPRPVIVTEQKAFDAEVGQPIRIAWKADLPAGTPLEPNWIISGLIGLKYNKKTVPWMRIHRQTGELSGVPRHSGVYPVVVGCYVTTDTQGKLDHDQVAADARLIVIHVKD